ncbi:MAG TPA: tetratricopeptide repeat protein [Candidatus Acidoferrum sp.]
MNFPNSLWRAPVFVAIACFPIGAAFGNGGGPSAGTHASPSAHFLSRQQGTREDLSAQESAARKALQGAPNSPEALARLGSILAAQGKLEEAAKYFERAVKLNPKDDASRRSLATSYWQLGQPQKARANLETVLRHNPGDAWATLLLGLVSEDLGDPEEAAKRLSSVLPLVHQRAEPVIALARAYYQLKLRDKARDTLGFLPSSPLGPQAVFQGAHVAVEFRDYETAEGLFATIRDTYPDAAELNYNLALAQYSAKHYEQSQKTLLDLIGGGQAKPDAYTLLGWTYQKQDRQEEMVRAFEKAINMDPAEQRRYLELGEALLEKKNDQTALEVAKETVKRFPLSAQAYRLKGAAELRMSRLSEAQQSYSKAVELDPNDSRPALGLALTLWNASRTDEAGKAFAEGVRKFPKDALFQLKYAIFLLNSSEERTAEQNALIKTLLKRSEELDDSIAETHFDLGNIALKENNYDEALKEFRAASELDPEMSKVHFALARLYRRLGREELAAQETAIHRTLKEKEDQESDPNAPKGTRHP